MVSGLNDTNSLCEIPFLVELRKAYYMKSILLVTPNKTRDASYSEMFKGSEVLASLTDVLRGTVAPVDLATLAALTPPEFDVDIWDEAVAGKITAKTEFAKPYELVGVTGYLANVTRMLRLRDEFHRRGVLTVAGGPACRIPRTVPAF
jgi:hypothetical protein